MQKHWLLESVLPGSGYFHRAMGQSDELNQKHAQIRNIDITEYTTHNSKRKYQAEASVGNAYRGKRSDAYLPTFNDALKTG